MVSYFALAELTSRPSSSEAMTTKMPAISRTAATVSSSRSLLGATCGSSAAATRQTKVNTAPANAIMPASLAAAGELA